jgi:hypothetical protein
MSALNELTTSLILEFPKEIYYFAATEFVTICSENNKSAIDLGFGLIAFAAGSMVKERLGNWILRIEFSKRSYIRRLQVHPVSLHPYFACANSMAV